MNVTVAEAASDLYALPRTEFRAARDHRAAIARAAGERAVAADIQRFARPTISAWLVNCLVRDAADQMGEFFALGKALREAQRVLDGQRLRELAKQRRRLIAALTATAHRLAAGHAVRISPQALRELHQTLAAALATPDAAQAVRTGRLHKPLFYYGLGAVDVRAVRAVREPAVLPQRNSPDLVLRRCEDRARQALSEFRDAERRLAAIAGQHRDRRDRMSELEQQVAELQRQLARARAEETRAAQQLAAARTDCDAASRAWRSAQRRLDEVTQQHGRRLWLVPPPADA